MKYSLTDHAAGRCFQEGFDIEDLLASLENPHYSQRDPFFGDRSVHYTRIAGQPAKVVTGAHNCNGAPNEQAIITVMKLDLNGRN
jgi:Domain of unknown function (DUF4258)